MNSKAINSGNLKIKALLLLPLWILLMLSETIQAGIPGFNHGYVYSRAAITNEQGQYTWGRYNPENGEYLGDIAVAGDSLNPAEWRVMSGDVYRSIIKQKRDLHKSQSDLELLSRADYESSDLLLANGQAMANKPALSATTAYVSILPQTRRLIDDPQSLILAQYPVNPDISVGDNIVSILYQYRGDGIGNIHLQSSDRIGFKAAFTKDKDGNAVASAEFINVNKFRSGEYTPVSPLEGVVIESARQPGGGMTDETGHYSALWMYPACPRFSMEYTNKLTAKLYYKRFNPRQKSRVNYTYTAQKTLYDYCVADFYMVPFFGPVPLGLGHINPNTYALSFPIDRSYLTGVAQLTRNAYALNDRVILGKGNVSVVDSTEYLAKAPDNSTTTSAYYDFDRDGITDTVTAGHYEDKPIDEGADACEAKGKTRKFVTGEPEEVQGVWLTGSGNTPENCQPNLTRVIDSNSYQDLTNQGLLSKIGAEDLRDTDIYIVRVSDGKLISERIGLNEYERKRISDLGEDRAKNQFFYTLEMRGSKLAQTFTETNYNNRNFKDWQSKKGMNPELHQREADHVQPGDQLRIYAINRATGYMGHVDTTYDISSTDSQQLGSNIDPIIMGPPNLRIKVERDYQIDKGASASDEIITQLIGFEGASLTSDKLVAITTEWLDHDGRPIPESLQGAGYTGRIAILSGDKTLPNDDQGVYQFAIEPGQRLQVLQLPNAISDSEHFYIHVSGQPKSGQAIFSGSTDNARRGEGVNFKSTGQNSGILEKRPDHYVPFLVPVFDEAVTELSKQAYLRTPAGQDVAPPEPVYRWVYRPEMQFTSYDLELNEINTSRDDDNSGTIEDDEIVNLLGDDSTLITADSIVDVLYDLTTTNLAALDYFNAGSDKELILSIGEQEVKATIGNDQQLVFDDLSHLNYLSPNDFLTLRLYANNDIGNTLWEYKSLIRLLSSRDISVNRSYFDAVARDETQRDYLDSHFKKSFMLSRQASVSLVLKDYSGEEVATIIPSASLAPFVAHNFAMSYEDIVSISGIAPAAGRDDYSLELKAVADEDESIRQTAKFSGNIEKTIRGLTLGQIIQHDVLIHSGSLSINRQDLNLPGLGPDLSFSRSYSNRSSHKGDMGQGWSHNLDIVLNKINVGKYDNPGHVPDWVVDNSGQFFDGPTVVQTEFSRIIISNGGQFVKVGSSWVPQRGYHGTVTEAGDGFDYRSKDGTTYHFTNYPGSTTLYVSSIEDRNNNTLNYEYETIIDLDGVRQRISKITDAIGRSLSFNYSTLTSGFVRLTGVSGPAGISLSFGYDDNGNLIQVDRDDISDYHETYGYEIDQHDASYNLTSVTDSNNHTISYDYYGQNELSNSESLKALILGFNPEDLVKTVTYPDSAQPSFNYLASGENTRLIKDAKGNTTKYVLTEVGNPLRIEEPGKTTQMTWSFDQGLPDNVMTSRTDAEGRHWSYEYDINGNVTKETAPDNKSTTSTWNEFSQLLTRIDRNNHKIVNAYNAKGDLLSEKDGEDFETTHTYDGNGLRLSTTDARGSKTTYSYDANGFLASQTGDEGSKTLFEYDLRGRLLSKTDPNGNPTSYVYDNLNRLTSQTDPDLATISYQYDNKGNKTQEVTREGITIDYTYDSRDRVKTARRTGPHITTANKTYSYDLNGNLTAESDWKGFSTVHAYDDLNRRTQTTNRDGKAMTFGYDAVGNKTSEIDYEGRLTSFIYDDFDRLTQTTQGDRINKQAYDAVGNVIETTDANNHTTTYQYDKRNLRILQTHPDNKTIQWAYDSAGNLSSETNENGVATSYGYDKQNRRVSMTQNDGVNADYVTTYAYDFNGNQTSITNPRNHTRITTYDELNRPLVETDFAGFDTSYSYSDAGNIITVTDALGHARTTTTDGLGHVISQTQADGGIISSEYDANGNNTKTTDTRNTVTSTTYDVLDRPITISVTGNSATRSISKTYDKVGNLLSATNGRNLTTTYTYNDFNEVETITDPAPFSYTQSFSYDKVGNKLSETDRRNNTTSYAYDNRNRLLRITDARNQIQSFTYDDVGNRITETDKRHTTTTHSYDDLNRLTQSSKAGITLVRNEYDGNGNIIKITDANGNITQLSYTARNELETTTYADNTTASQSYDEVGNLLSKTDEAGQVSSYTYDAENRLASETNPASETTAYTYDTNGNKLTTSKPEGNGWSYSYDGLNRLLTASNTLGHSTSYEYDDNDNLTAQIDAATHRVEYGYDELDRRVSHKQLKSSGNLTVSYAYDANGNMTSSTDAKGQVISYVYDVLNRETSRNYPDTGGPFIDLQSIATVYDANDNPTSITETKDQSGSAITDVTSNTYDLLDRLLTSTQRGKTITYTYDDNGNRTSVSTAAGSTSYTFDSRNRIETAVAGSETTSYSYYPDGKQKQVSYPNGTQTRREYDAADRVKNIVTETTADATLLSQYEYTYDSNGNRLTQQETQNGQTDTTSYTYDSADRMESFTLVVGSDTTLTEYTLDSVSNRLTEKVSLNSVVITDKSYVYDETSWLQSITDNLQSKDIVYSYDNNGNTIQKLDNTEVSADKSTVFSYNSRDQLVQTRRGADGSEITTLGLYDYNAAGLRVRHYNSERGNIHYYYDDQSVIEERTEADNLLAHYRFADKLLSLQTPTETNFYHQDALGSTTNLTDVTGAVKVSYKLDPWGQVREQTGSSVNRQIFTGQETDENTGLIYFGARFYDPDTGRFITQDSYLGRPAEPPSLHRYLYAGARPTFYVDEDGHCFGLCIGGAILIGGAIANYFYDMDDARKDMNNAIRSTEPSNPVTMGLAATSEAVVTVGTGVLGFLPTTGKQIGEFLANKDRTLADAPILGPVGTHLGESSAAFVENPNFDTGVQAFGAVSSAFLTTVAPVSAKGFKGKAKITEETRTGSLEQQSGNVGDSAGAMRVKDSVVETGYTDAVESSILRHQRKLEKRKNGDFQTRKNLRNIEQGRSKYSPETTGRSSPGHWGEYIEEIFGVAKPLEDTHGHHIVFKSQFPKITNLSKAILEKFEIDWFKGPENLVHAPNRNHSIKAAEAVQKALLDANQVGTRDAVVKALQKMGREFAEEGPLISK